jgi:UDP-N-acetylmuramyl pentapeptide phosphotransferase/UDP-N-acetylglucosamine-1-phosphate transferase
MISGFGYIDWPDNEATDGNMVLLLLAAAPVFFGGVTEDLTKKVSVGQRLLLSMLSGALGAWLFGAILHRSGVPFFDYALRWQPFAVAFTIFAVSGVTNAINMIDGFNGLVSGYAILVLAVFSWVSWLLGDTFLVDAALAMMGSVVGFHYWNYPHGKIFLGDGGAYFLGFWLAEMSVLMLARHPMVSPWFTLLLLAYPVSETMFTMYRRRLLRRDSLCGPDGLHLHTLIFRRLNRIKWASRGPDHKTSCNSMTAPYFWVIKSCVVVLAILFWDNSTILMLCTLLFVGGYVWVYRKIVTFRTPPWLVRRDRRDRMAGGDRRNNMFFDLSHPALLSDRRRGNGQRRTTDRNMFNV